MVMDKYFVKSVGTLINSSFPQGMENSIVLDFGILKFRLFLRIKEEFRLTKRYIAH